MRQKNSKQIHELYHRTTKKQLKLISTNNFTYRLIIKFLNKYIKYNSNNTILDIGSGAGSISFYLAARGNLVTGIDISSKAIQESKKSANLLNLKNANFICSSFPEDFSLSKKFDAVVFTEVIEHLEDDNLALYKINTLLKKGGLLFLSTPSQDAPLYKLGLTKKFDKEVGHLRRYTLQQLKSLLKKNGFRIVEISKTEGVLRNFLFVNPYAGKLVRFVNIFASDFTTFLDNISLKLFGNSNFIIVARKK